MTSATPPGTSSRPASTRRRRAGPKRRHRRTQATSRPSPANGTRSRHTHGCQAIGRPSFNGWKPTCSLGWANARAPTSKLPTYWPYCAALKSVGRWRRPTARSKSAVRSSDTRSPPVGRTGTQQATSAEPYRHPRNDTSLRLPTRSASVTCTAFGSTGGLGASGSRSAASRIGP